MADGCLPAEIARHFRFGSQEDAHEFLRYTIDAMQKACLNGCTRYWGAAGGGRAAAPGAVAAGGSGRAAWCSPRWWPWGSSLPLSPWSQRGGITQRGACSTGL